MGRRAALDLHQRTGRHAARARLRPWAATPMLFRATDKTAGAFAPLAPPLDRIHRELKRAFDPDGVFNPGRLVPGL